MPLLRFFHSVSRYTVIHIKDNRCCYMLRTIFEDSISKCLYPITLFTWTNAFHPHDVVLKNSSSLNTCTLTFGRLDGDCSGNFSYSCSLGRKKDERSVVDQELVNEINDLIEGRILVYHRDVENTIDGKVCCAECFKHLSMNQLVPG